MDADITPFQFQNRSEAGQLLADKLALAPPEAGTVVLALPRGGVPVGLAIARQYGLPLEPLVVRKLGVPSFPEFAMGAMAAGGQCVLDRELVQRLHLSDAEVDQVIQHERAELAERERRYRISAPLESLRGRPVIVVDDGMATGSTMQAAIAALRAVQVGAVTVAVPVLTREALLKIERLASHVLWLVCPEAFESVGQYYRDFHQLRDDEVIAQLSRAQRLSVSDLSAGATSPY
jgi:predicted phosphoribosyltransferase